MNHIASAFKRTRARPLIFGHRGARAVAPENTIAAFEQALQDGADGVELDVRLSSCGTLIIHHDATIKIGMRSVAVSTLNYSQLSSLRPRDEARICTLEEALDWAQARQSLVNIELKSSGFASLYMTRKAVQIARQYEADSLLFSSFDLVLLLWLQANAPEFSRALLTFKGQLAFETLLRFLPLNYFAGASALHPEVGQFKKVWLEKAIHQGMLINLWTVLDSQTANEMSALGINSLICDHPAEIIASLEEQA